MGFLTRIRVFLAEVKAEMKRTSWPSGKEVRGTTTVVIVTVFIFATFLWIVDMFLFRLVDWIFRVAG
jgi:preprotein translocase subunit SecE